MDDDEKLISDTDREIDRLLCEHADCFNFRIGDLTGFDRATRDLLLSDMKKALGISDGDEE